MLNDSCDGTGSAAINAKDGSALCPVCDGIVGVTVDEVGVAWIADHAPEAEEDEHDFPHLGG